MKKNGTLFLLILLYYCASAQNKPFDIKGYKLPYLQRHSLVFDFDLSQKAEYSKDDYNNKNNIFDNKRDDYNTNFNFRYSYYLNDTTVQIETSAYIENYFGYGKNWNSDENEREKTFTYMPTFSIKHTWRKYFKGLYYYELNLDQQLYLRNFYDKHWDIDENEITKQVSKSYTNTTHLPLKIGIGRIERVEDVRHAYFILQQLKKEGCIQFNDSSSGIYNFSQFISELKNKRFFDYRKRKIYEIEALDSFLIANKYVTESSARYFTTLYDFWVNGAWNSLVHKQGTRVAFAVNPKYLYDSDFKKKPNSTAENIEHDFLLQCSLELDYYNAINMYWQHNISLYLNGGVLFSNYKKHLDPDPYKNSKTTIFKAPFFSMSLNEEIAYYPNTRTKINIYYDFGLLHNQLDFVGVYNQHLNEFNVTRIYITGGVDVYYYISTQCRLFLNYSLTFNWFEDKGGLTIQNLPSYGGISLFEYKGPIYIADLKTFKGYFNMGFIYELF